MSNGGEWRCCSPTTSSSRSGVLKAAGGSRGWRCLEVGAGGGDITRWLAKTVTPGGSVVAVDLETRWIESLASDAVDVRRGDFGKLDFARASFDLIVAQMLLP